MKPKILILGHKGHGKTELANLIAEEYGLTHIDTSEVLAEKVVFPYWGQFNYTSIEDMVANKDKDREAWANALTLYNTGDKTRFAREMLELGSDIYTGMRSYGEVIEARKELFDIIIWVSAFDRVPVKEDTNSMTCKMSQADHIIYNNGDINQLKESVKNLDKVYPQLKKPEIKPAEVTDMYDIPKGATPVLDHGYVLQVDVNGTDADIAQAARLSYGRGTKKVNNDEGLIRYLYTNAHTSPFEMVGIKFQMRLPIVVMRQLVRHRTASLNEYSGRYSEMPELFYVPKPEDIKHQDLVNKQGASGMMRQGDAEEVVEMIRSQSEDCFETYQNLLNMGVAREMARIILPLNTYTEIVWKMDLNNMFKLLLLRDDHHAQPEIRAFARVMASYVEAAFPLAYAAYERRKQSVTLSQDQIHALALGDLTKLPKGEAKQLSDIINQMSELRINRINTLATYPKES